MALGSGPRARRAAGFLIILGIAILAGVVATAFQGWVFLMWAGACLTAGLAVGFLFAIPRSLRGEQQVPPPAPPTGNAAPGSAPHPAYRVNTNLEEISDWLTKIMVGLGLTQIAQVPARLQEAAAYIASGAAHAQAGAVFAGAMIVYFSVTGFIVGYLTTRFYLVRLFEWAEKSEEERVKRIAKTVTDAAARVRQDDLNFAILYALQDLARRDAPRGSLQEDINRLELFRKDFETHRSLHIVLDRLYGRLGQHDKSIEILSAFLDAKTRQHESGDNDFADALYNRACAYSLKAESADGAEKEKLQNLALKDLEDSIGLSPDNAREALDDPDLAPLRRTEKFQSLVRPGPTAPSSQPS